MNQLADRFGFYLHLTVDLTMQERNFLVTAEVDQLIGATKGGGRIKIRIERRKILC